MKLIACILAVAVAACGGDAEPDAVPPVLVGNGRAQATLADLPSMPTHPSGQSGQLTVTSAGDYVIEGAWEARAGVCEQLGFLELYAGVPDTGTLIVLRFGDGDPLDRYPVGVADLQLPDPPAARIGVQLLGGEDALGFQAIEGELEVSSFGGDLSGRFATTLQEIRSGILTRYVGVFDRVPVEPLSAEYCRDMIDSTESEGESESTSRTSRAIALH